jgi:hypothetical protein
MTILLILTIGATCALAAIAAVRAHAEGRPLLWQRVLTALAIEYAAGAVLGCWTVTALLGPAAPVLDRLLVGS